MDQQQQQQQQQQQHQQHQQQKMPFHQQLQQQQQQQLLLLQQLQKQAQQQQQAAVMSRFPSNIDAHLRTPGVHHRPPLFQNPNASSNSSSNHNSILNTTPNPNTGSNPNPPLNNSGMLQQIQQGSGGGGSSVVAQSSQPQSQPQPQPQQQQQHQQKGSGGGMVMRPPPVNQVELQMAYHGAWLVCHPDFKRPFASLEDACERLLPYHVVADYEAEEDDKILDSDTTGQMPSRSQQWDHNIAAKVAEFTGTFEKQALAFNIITRKRAMGEFRSEERLMIEQALLQEEKRLLLDTKAEIEAREKAGREAQFRMAAMVQAEHARVESHAHSEMMTRGPIRTSAFGSQINNMGMVHGMPEQDHAINPEEMMNGWGNNPQRDEKEPSDDFLNDDDTENGDVGTQSEWRGVGEFDLNSR